MFARSASSRARVSPRGYGGIDEYGPESADEPKLAMTFTPRGTAWGAAVPPPPTELPPQEPLPPSSRSNFFHIFGGW